MSLQGRMLVYASEQRLIGARSKADTQRDACADSALSHLMPVPVCLLVAAFDLTVERAQNEESDGRSSSVAPFIITAKLNARRAGSS